MGTYVSGILRCTLSNPEFAISPYPENNCEFSQSIRSNLVLEIDTSPATATKGLGVDERGLESLSRARREAKSLRVALFVQEISFVAVNHDGATASNLFTPVYGSAESREIASEKKGLWLKPAAANNRHL
ncbi:hypothetical protein CDAR_63601 [Caerostris darwini]|uniref:Uncharacterized protein n=1 Tax=Caerostris darwini TaxID=1538125 RepID=A0AAV4QFX2_9ARAC|nr:hypothetical protein CDAR_63601 [Caerostris darwini]